MSFQHAIKKCFSNYVTFSGRAPRSEFWWFMLFIFAGNLFFGIVDAVFFGDMVEEQPVSVVGALFALAVFLPSLAVSVRRLHDLDKSGWWYLLVLIPILGALVLIYFFIQQGTKGANRFGSDPLTGSDATA